jgi:hypothetical protein
MYSRMAFPDICTHNATCIEPYLTDTPVKPRWGYCWILMLDAHVLKAKTSGRWGITSYCMILPPFPCSSFVSAARTESSSSSRRMPSIDIVRPCRRDPCAICNLTRKSCHPSASLFRKHSTTLGSHKSPWASQSLQGNSWLVMGTPRLMVAQLSCLSSPVQADREDGQDLTEDQSPPPTPEPPWEPKLLAGTAIMFAVALMWGTNPVCTRFLYLSAEPPSSAVLAAVQATVSAIFLGILFLVQSWQGGRESGPARREGRPVLGDGPRRLGHEAEIRPLQREDDDNAGPATDQREVSSASWTTFGRHPVPVPNQVTLPLDLTQGPRVMVPHRGLVCCTISKRP